MYHVQVVGPMKDYLAELGGSRPAPAGSEPGELGQARHKLLELLDSSLHYTPQKMISTFLAIDGLYEERAILLGRIGRHDQALSIYAYKLNDPTRAEAYCQKQYDLDRESSRDVFFKLLEIYLQPGKGFQVCDCESRACCSRRTASKYPFNNTTAWMPWIVTLAVVWARLVLPVMEYLHVRWINTLPTPTASRHVCHLCLFTARVTLGIVRRNVSCWHPCR